MVSAGRVLLMPKGDYNSGTAYELLDVVLYNGSSYVAKGDTTGNLPTNTTYWQLLAYGGNVANVSANFATVETTAYASQHFDVGDLLVNSSNQFCEVTTEILQGDEIILYPETGSNVKLTNVETLINAVKASIDSVASDVLDVEASIADIEASTTASAAHAIGEKFYLNNVLYEAIAAITIGDTIVLPPDVNATVKVSDTVIEQIEAVADDLDTLDSAKQNKTLATPITIEDVQQTSVEGALGGLNNSLVNTKNNLEHRNLLDNPWFTINQRNFNSSVNGAYGYDRWTGKYSYDVNGVSLTATDYLIQKEASQLKEFANGKYFTASVMLADGTIYAGTAQYSTSSDVVFISNDDLDCSSGSFDDYNFSVTAKKNLIIKAVKFELGLVCTLGIDAPPDYSEELAKCKRYYEQLTFPQYASIAHVDAAPDFATMFLACAEKRTLPTISYSGNLGYVATGGENIDNAHNTVSPAFGGYNVGGSRTTTGQACSGYAYAADAGGCTIAISADL